MVRAVSLFSGCGGCSLGLHQAGIEVALAADIDDDACATYAANLGHDILWPGVDLSTVSPDVLLEKAQLGSHQVDIIVGGPPCQGFSSAGARDWTDPRNTLLRHFVEIVISIRPTWFIMENVEGLLTANGGLYIIEAISRLLEAGYWVRAKKIYMEQYGVPQRRKRVIIVGNLEQHAFAFPLPTHHARTATAQLWGERLPLLSILDAIGDLPPAPDAIDADEADGVGDDDWQGYTIEPTSHYQEQMRRTDNNPVWLHKVKRMNLPMQQRIRLLKPGATMKSLPEELQHPSYRRRAFRRVMDGTPTEKRGGAPSGLKRLIGTEPSLTITSASPTEFVHPIYDRTLSLRECARIQSFPDWFEFAGSWSSVATQIGNAIPPLFMRLLATHILSVATWQKAPNPMGRWLGIDATKATAMSPALAHMLEDLEERTIAYV